MKCSAIEEMILPEGLASLGERAFAGCSEIKNIAIPESVKEIKDGAFEGCYSVEEIILPKGVAFIGANAFSGCSLSKVIVPKGVGSLGENAFRSNRDVIIYYEGDAGEWKNLHYRQSKNRNAGFEIYCYSATRPFLRRDTWHYDGDTPVIWSK